MQLQQQHKNQRLVPEALRFEAPDVAVPRPSSAPTAMAGSALLSATAQQDPDFALLQQHFDIIPRTRAKMVAAMRGDAMQQARDPLALERTCALQQHAFTTGMANAPAFHGPAPADLDLELLAQPTQRFRPQAAHGSPPALDRLLRLAAQQQQQQWVLPHLQHAGRNGLRPASGRTPSPVLAAVADAGTFGLPSDARLPSPTPAAQQLQQGVHLAPRSASGRSPSPGLGAVAHAAGLCSAPSDGPTAGGAGAVGSAASLRAAAADLAAGPPDPPDAQRLGQRLAQRAQLVRGAEQHTLEQAHAQLAQQGLRPRGPAQHAQDAARDAALQAWQRARAAQPEQPEGPPRGKRRRTMPLNSFSGMPAQAGAHGGALSASAGAAPPASAGRAAIKGGDRGALHPNAIKLQLAIQAAKLRAGASGVAGSDAPPRQPTAGGAPGSGQGGPLRSGVPAAGGERPGSGLRGPLRSGVPAAGSAPAAGSERPDSGQRGPLRSGSDSAGGSAAAGKAGTWGRPSPSAGQPAASAGGGQADDAGQAAAGGSAWSEEYVVAAVAAAADSLAAATAGAAAAGDGARAAANGTGMAAVCARAAADVRAAANGMAAAAANVRAAVNGMAAAASDLHAAANGTAAVTGGRAVAAACVRAAAAGPPVAAAGVPAARACVAAADEAAQPASAPGAGDAVERRWPYSLGDAERRRPYSVGDAERPRLYSLGDAELRRLRRELLQGVALWDRGIRVPAADRRLQMALAYLRFHTALVEQLQRVHIVEVAQALLGHPCPGVRGSASALLQVPSWAEVHAALMAGQQHAQQLPGEGSSGLELVGTPPGADRIAGPQASGGAAAVPVMSM